MLMIKSKYNINISVFCGEITYNILVLNNRLNETRIFHKKS